MEVWDNDEGVDQYDDRIDNFMFPLSNPLNKFNSSNSLTFQGLHKVGNLTLSFGNLTTDPTPCNLVESVMYSTFTHDDPTTASYQCSSVESPTSTTSTQPPQGLYYKNKV